MNSRNNKKKNYYNLKHSELLNPLVEQEIDIPVHSFFIGYFLDVIVVEAEPSLPWVRLALLAHAHEGISASSTATAVVEILPEGVGDVVA